MGVTVAVDAIVDVVVGITLVAVVLGVGQSRSMTICGCPPNLFEVQPI